VAAVIPPIDDVDRRAARAATGIRSAFSIAALERRVYVNGISLPQTCRLNWYAIQPTTKSVMAGHQLPLTLANWMTAMWPIAVIRPKDLSANNAA